MTGTGPPPEIEFVEQPPALARALAMLLVTRYRLRLCDPRDSRLGELASEYELAAATWTGSRSALVAFYTPTSDPAAQVADLHRRIGAALRWGDSRLRMQPAQRCDITLVPLAPVRAQLPLPAHPAVTVGVVWVDPATAEAGALLPPPPNLPGAGEIRSAARALLRGTEAPTLAAVDLAEREAVHGGYVAPVRQALRSTPRLTYGLVAVFVVFFLAENTLIQHYGNAGYLAAGGIAVGGLGGGDWWRYLSTAFLHLPGGFGFWPATGPLSYISLHLIINSYSAIVLGRIIEPMYGRLTLLGTFLATAFVSSGVSAAAAAFNLPGSSPLFLGASGGLMGLLGLLFTIGRVQGRNVPAGLARALRQGVLLSLGLTLLIGFTVAGINNYAHLGGFASGALIGLAFPPVRAVGGKDLARWQQVALIAVIALSGVALLFAIANIGMFLSGNPAPLSGSGF
jgi:membrane associated rhomboid family serine protease